MLPGKGFRVAIGLGDDRNEDEALELAFYALIYMVSLQQAIVGVGIEVNRNGLFDSSGQFFT